MNAEQQLLLFNNIAAAMDGVADAIIERQLKHFHLADPAYAQGVREALAARKS